MDLGSPDVVKKGLIVGALIFLVVSAFLMRRDIFIHSRVASIDEIVYYRMGRQVLRNWLDYNTIPYAYKLKGRGRDLPEYFFQPLYKHPPLFTFLLAGAMKVFGLAPVAAEYVPLLFGILMIPLTYLLGTMVFSRTTGLLAAFLVCFDPVSAVTSLKIWSDSALAFFMVLAVYFFVRAIKLQRDRLFVFSGVAIGLAVLTKYPGILPLAGMGLYAVFYRPDLLWNRKFLLGAVVPFLMLLPWFFWQYAVYGLAFVSRQARIHNFLPISQRTIVYLAVLTVLSFAVVYLYAASKRGRRKPFYQGLVRLSSGTKGILGVLFFIALYKYVYRGLHPFHLPEHGWTSSIFSGEPPLFYFGRLLEYSPLYAFAYISFLNFSEKQNGTAVILKINALAVLLFFTIWHSYQTRYVLAALPLLIILGLHQGKEIFLMFERHPRRAVRGWGTSLMIFLGVLIVWRLFYLNLNMTWTNFMCYY